MHNVTSQGVDRWSYVAGDEHRLFSINEQQVVLRIEGSETALSRRSSDRPVSFVVELNFTEKKVATKDIDGKDRGTFIRTFVDVLIRPRQEQIRLFVPRALLGGDDMRSEQP